MAVFTDDLACTHCGNTELRKIKGISMINTDDKAIINLYGGK